MSSQTCKQSNALFSTCTCTCNYMSMVSLLLVFPILKLFTGVI